MKVLNICVFFDKISIVSLQTRETFWSASIHVLQYNGEKTKVKYSLTFEVTLAKFWHVRYLINEILWNVEQK